MTGSEAIAAARLKDGVDSRTLAHLLRADLLPEAWIAPVPVRELRALLRHRVVLVRLGTAAKNRIHAVLADRGLDREEGLWSGPGRAWLAGLELPATARLIVDDHLARSSTRWPRRSPRWRRRSPPGPNPTRE